ncbi:MAG: cytochrome C [Rhodanobacteraceae bacterium]
MRFIGAFILWVIIFIIVGAIFIWSGVYDVAADRPDSSFVHYLVSQVREHSIAQRAHGATAPNLDDAALVKEGAEHYAEMCSGCHLAPGLEDSEIRHGLNPKPPNLTRFAPDPQEAFWIIKHGIKMTGMPAWGPTHDDQKIWAMVAYLQKQPKMSAVEYQQLTGNAAAAHEQDDHGVAGLSGGMTMPMPAATATPPASASTR